MPERSKLESTSTLETHEITKSISSLGSKLVLEAWFAMEPVFDHLWHPLYARVGLGVIA